MKNAPLFTLISIALTFTLALTSCQKETGILTDNFTEQDAKFILEESLKSTSQELNANLFEMILEIIADVDLVALCDSVHTYNFNFDHQGYYLDARFNSDLSYLIDCEQFIFWNVPQSAELLVETEAALSTEILQGSYTSELNGELSELLTLNQPWKVNGSYVRNGLVDYQPDAENPVRTNVSLVANLTDLTLNKQTLLIDSGTGSFTFTALNANNEFALEGSLDVKEPNVFVFTLNGEEFFVLDLNL